MAAASRPLELSDLRSAAAIWIDEGRARIAVSGEDRLKWLNGVLTSDVRPLEDPRAKGSGAQYACALTSKGKILADAILVVEGEACGVWVPARAAPGLIETWEAHVIMEDVELARDDARRLVVVQGEAAQKLVDDAGLGARAAPLDLLGLGGVVLDVARDEAQAIVERLASSGARRIDASDAGALFVEAGRATFGRDFDAGTYVQEAGLEKRAVSFTKGCYLGQEVVCMMEMRGHPSKKLVQLAVPAGDPVGSGDEVRADGATIGKITSVVANDDGSAVALAMVKWAHATPGAKLDVRGRLADVTTRAT